MQKAQDLDSAYGLDARGLAARARVEQSTSFNDGDVMRRSETDDGSGALTDLQRAALRWLASFD